jgi:hypothetical protein
LALSNLHFYCRFFLAFFLFYKLCSAQPQGYRLETWVDTTTREIGEPFHLFFRLAVPKGAALLAPQIQTPLGVFEKLEDWQLKGPNHREDSSVYLGKLKLAAFDTGRLALPRLPLIIQNNNNRDSLLTPQLYIRVNAIAIDPKGKLRPIKDVMTVPLPLWPAALRLLAALSGALIIWLLWRKYQKKRRKKAAPLPVILQETATPRNFVWQTVWNALEELEKKTPTTNEKEPIIAFYSELTYWIRFYLEKEKAIKALELSSPEIITQLQAQGAPAEIIEEFEKIAYFADQVKFAKIQPQVPEHLVWLRAGRDLLLRLRRLTHTANESIP